jgi:hypothetical protein
MFGLDLMAEQANSIYSSSSLLSFGCRLKYFDFIFPESSALEID